MKAVVLEVRDGFAAVLQEDGTVTKIRTDARVGETIQLPEQKKKPVLGRSLRAAVAGLALVGILAGTGYSYTSVMAYSYVSLDIADTSLEYTLNRRDQVLSVEGKNDSSLDLAQELSGTVRRKDLSEALEETVERIGSEDDYALVAVTSGSDKRAEDLQQTVHQRFEQEEGGPEVVTDIATRQEHDEARQQGVTAGRYRIGRELGDPEDYRSANIGDMLDRAGRVERPGPPREDQAPPKPGQGQFRPEGQPEPPPENPKPPREEPPERAEQPEPPSREEARTDAPQEQPPRSEQLQPEQNQPPQEENAPDGGMAPREGGAGAPGMP